MPDSLEYRQECYIISDGGQIIFHSYLGKIQCETDEDLKQFTASYLTAVLQFAKAATKGNIINSLEMEKSRVSLKIGVEMPVFYILILGKQIKVNQKKIWNFLTAVATEFERRFCLQDLKEWDGSSDFFNAFCQPFQQMVKKHL